MAHTGKRGPSNELDGGKVRKQRITSAVTELLNCETALNNTSGDEKRRDGQKVLRNSVYSKKSLSCEAGPASRSAFLNKEKNICLVNKLRKSGDDCSGHREIPVADKSEGEFVLTHTTELESMKRLDDQKGKRKGIDSNLMQQCYIVLKKLMNHPSGWAFNQPVDPVKLQIPDYFSIISKPMDLGTIKHKLEKKQYLDIQNFVADVRLTFTNAMLYNPPANGVHIMASKLNNYFEMLWKSLEANLSLGSSKVGPKANTNERLKDTRNLKRDNLKESDSCLNILPRTSMPSGHRQKMRKDLLEISEGKIPSDFLDRLRRIGLVGQNEEKIQVDFSTCDDRKLSEWYKAIKPYLDSRSIKSVPVKNCSQLSSSKKDLCGETGTQVRKACNKFIVRETSTPARFGGPCTPGGGFNASQGLVSNCINSKHETRGLRTASCSSYVRDPVGKGTVCQRVSKSGPDFTGAVSTSDEKVQHDSSPVTPTTAATCLEGWEATLNDLHLSPTKAHRAAMLKKRFANTIMRAQTNTLLCNGEKRDPVRMQQEKEILRKLQKEAQIRAAAEAKLKMQREREREEARITLLKMEKTVEIYEDEEILKEIEELGYPRVCGGRIRNPLERLGLFLKTDFIEEEQEVEKEKEVAVKDLTGDLEEGEFVS